MMHECYQSSIGLKVLEQFSSLTRSVKIVGVKNIIPSRTVVANYNNWLTAGMSTSINFKILKDGAGCVLDVELCLIELIKNSKSIQDRGFTEEEYNSPGFDIESKAIVIAATNDGAKCTNATGMILFCLKFPDLQLIQEFKAGRNNDNFNYQKSIELESDDVRDIAAINLCWEGVQSMKYLGLIGWLEGDDNEENNRLLAKYCFTTLNNLCSEYYSYNGKSYNFDVFFPGDMKAIWCDLSYGGGSHCTSHFCWICCSRSHDRAYPSFYQCDDCKRLNKPEGYCYHCEELSSFQITRILRLYDNPLATRYQQRFIKYPDTKQKASIKFLQNFLNKQFNVSLKTLNTMKLNEN
jgi:hypothetical protein